MARIYTRTGDDGTTGLGSGRRVVKESPRIEACGSVDELNAQLGGAVASGLCARLDAVARRIQSDLHRLGADLGVPEAEKDRRPVPRIEERHVASLEELIDELEAELEPLSRFILPGGSPGAAHLHVARTVCRRAERRVVALAREEAVGQSTIRYLNRLSDALFVMARYENHQRGVDDVIWDGSDGDTRPPAGGAVQ